MSLKRLLLMLMVFIAIPSLLLAQESLTETYVSPDERLTLRYPEGWIVNTEDEGITLIATSEGMVDAIDDAVPVGEAAMALLFSDNDPTDEQLFESETPSAILSRFVELIGESGDARFTEPVRYMLAGLEGARATGRLDSNEVLVIALDLGDGVFEVAIAVTASGEMDRFEGKMIAILESVNYLPLVEPNVELDTMAIITPENAEQLAQLWTVTPHVGLVYSVAISPDGSTIASGGVDGEIYLLDATDGAVIQTLSGHTSGVEQVLFSPEGDALASLSSDGSFRLWDVATGDERLVFEHDEPLFYMAYSPGGRFIAFSSYTQDPETFETASSTVWLVDTQDERERSIIKLEDDLFVNSVAFSPDSNELLFSASNDQDPDKQQTNVWLWDIERDQEIDSWAQDGNPVDVFFTPAGRMYTTMNDTSDPNDLLLWDVTENYIQERLTGFGDLTYHVVLNAAGTIMGAASYDGTVRLWAFDNLEEVAVLRHEGGAYGVALSDDGRLLATSDDLGNVVLWGVTNASNI